MSIALPLHRQENLLHFFENRDPQWLSSIVSADAHAKTGRKHMSTK